MNRGYYKSWRKQFDSGMHRNHKLFVLWHWILGHAAYKPASVIIGTQKITLKPGQMIVGRQKLALDLNMSEQNVRTCLSSLESFGNITIEPTNKFSVITVVNWESYQSFEEDFNQQANQQLTSGSPATNQQLTTSKEVKKVKKEKKERQYSASGDAVGSQTDPFYLTKKKRKLSGKRLETFERFFEAFGLKRGKAEAADAWMDIPQLTNALVEQIIEAAKREAARRPAIIAEGRTPKWAQGWISGRRWEDEAVEPQDKKADLSHIKWEQ